MVDEEVLSLTGPKYGINKQTLDLLVSSYRTRNRYEDLEFIEEICRESTITSMLNVDPSTGINSSEINERRSLFGFDKKDKSASKRIFKTILMSYYLRYLVPILISLSLFALLLQIIIGITERSRVIAREYISIIGVSVFYELISIIIRHISHKGEGRKLKKVMESLKRTNVYREGKLVNIHYSELTTGDIIELQSGMFVPADILAFEAYDLTTDEFKYTHDHHATKKQTLIECQARRGKVNESQIAKYNLPSPILLAGSYILTGEGKGVVLLTGAASTLGKIQKTTYTYAGTNIQLKLEVAGIRFVTFGIRITTCTFLILQIRYFFGSELENLVEELLRYMIYVVAILAFITVEDLIMILHDTIGKAVWHLLSLNVFPRRFLAIDGLILVNDICADMTQMEKDIGKVKESIDECTSAQIRVKMVASTGYNEVVRTARECGLVEAGSEDMCIYESKRQNRKASRSLTNLDSKEEISLFPLDLRAFANLRSAEKDQLVCTLQDKRSTVAFVGKSIEDVSTLTKANIGFVLGSGTDIAKNHADFILIDESFTNIVETIKWGRAIYDNIQKYFQFRMPTIISMLSITFIGSLLIGDPIFRPTQLIWILLIMDLSGRFLIALERPNKTIMMYKSISDPYIQIVSNKMKKHMISQAVYQIIVVLVLLFSAPHWVPDDLDVQLSDANGKVLHYSVDGLIRSGWSSIPSNNNEYYTQFEMLWGASRHTSLIFNTYVLMIIASVLNCRTIRDEKFIWKGTRDDIRYVIVFILILCSQFAVGNFSGPILSVSPYGMTMVQWGIAALFALGGLVPAIILRLIRTKEKDDEEEKEEKDEKGENIYIGM